MKTKKQVALEIAESLKKFGETLDEHEEDEEEEEVAPQPAPQKQKKQAVPADLPEDVAEQLKAHEGMAEAIELILADPEIGARFIQTILQFYAEALKKIPAERWPDDYEEE